MPSKFICQTHRSCFWAAWGLIIITLAGIRSRENLEPYLPTLTTLLLGKRCKMWNTSAFLSIAVWALVLARGVCATSCCGRACNLSRVSSAIEQQYFHISHAPCRNSATSVGQSWNMNRGTASNSGWISSTFVGDACRPPFLGFSVRLPFVGSAFTHTAAVCSSKVRACKASKKSYNCLNYVKRCIAETSVLCHSMFGRHS